MVGNTKMKIFDFNLFKKKKEPKPKTILSDEEKFNVENFNDWFNTIYDGYTGRPGAPGIFLRTDKLGNNMIEDWFEYLNVEYSYAEVIKMHELVRLNWKSQY